MKGLMKYQCCSNNQQKRSHECYIISNFYLSTSTFFMWPFPHQHFQVFNGVMVFRLPSLVAYYHSIDTTRGLHPTPAENLLIFIWVMLLLVFRSLWVFLDCVKKHEVLWAPEHAAVLWHDDWAHGSYFWDSWPLFRASYATRCWVMLFK